MRKIIMFILSILTVISLSSCNKNTFNVNDKTTINLNINTDVTDYEVSSSYGNISMISNNKYQIIIDMKKSFTVTISKDGYYTEQINFDSKDLNKDVIEKNVDFGRNSEVKVFVRVSGFINEVEIKMGNNVFKKEKDRYVVDITRSDLGNITINSLNGESRTIELSEEDKLKNYIFVDAFITKKGTKAIKVDNYYGNSLISTANDIFKIYDDRNNKYILINKDFVGDILVGNKKYKINSSVPTYGYMINTYNVKEISIDNYLKELYFEDENGKLQQIYVDPNTNIFSISNNIKKARLWSEENGTLKYYNYNGENEIRIKDFKIAENIVSDLYCLVNFYGIQLEDQSFITGNNEKVIIKDNLINKPFNDLYLTTPNGETISYNDNINLYNMVVIDNKLYRKASVDFNVEFTLNFYKKDGTKVLVNKSSFDTTTELNSYDLVTDRISLDRNLLFIESENSFYYIQLEEFNINEWTKISNHKYQKDFVVEEEIALIVNFTKRNLNIVDVEVNNNKYENRSFMLFNLNHKYEFNVFGYNYNSHNSELIKLKYNLNFKNYTLGELCRLIGFDREIALEL